MKRIIGILMIVSVFVFMVVDSASVIGLSQAIESLAIAIFLTVLLVIGVNLVED